MHQQLTPSALRDEVRAWLDEHWSAEVPRKEWLAAVVDAGYAVPTWPAAWFGRGLDADLADVVAAEFRRAGAPGAAQDLHNLWANTVLAFGTEAAEAALHPAAAPRRRGDVPAVLRARGRFRPRRAADRAPSATATSGSSPGRRCGRRAPSKADYGMLVARTDWDVPKHRGISFFWCPMKQHGVEVRPIRQITGESHFNEVFLDGARIPGDHLVGGLNEGWRVLQTALAYERSVMGDVARGPRSAEPKPAAGDEPDARRAAVDEPKPAASSGPQGAEVDLWALARDVGRADDPVIRQAIARVHTLRTVNRWNGQRAKAQLAQGTSSPILSLGKLAMSGILHEGAHVQRLIVGADALLDGPANPRGDDANFLSLNAFFTSIGGGTDQIQRNIIGERVLGLPREPEVDRDVPFRDVAKATVSPTLTRPVAPAEAPPRSSLDAGSQGRLMLGRHRGVAILPDMSLLHATTTPPIPAEDDVASRIAALRHRVDGDVLDPRRRRLRRGRGDVEPGRRRTTRP